MMNISVLREFEFDVALGGVRMVEAALGKNIGKGVFFVYTQEGEGADPCHSTLAFHKHPVRMAMFGPQGQLLWSITLGMGVMPCIWTSPFIAFDMDGDGVDEIWFVNQYEARCPLNQGKFVLERIHAVTGEIMDTKPFPADNCQWERVDWAYRFMLIGGYVHGEPVLVTTQGLYSEMFLQAYNADMSLRWERNIKPFAAVPQDAMFQKPVGAPGSRASHEAPVLDINHDGIDEFLWGERAISFDDGQDIFCLDQERYHGHSDLIIPFIDYETGKMYVFTGRETGDYLGCPRVVTFDAADGSVVWEDIYSESWGHYQDDGHIHYGWIATVEPDYRRVAFAYRRREKIRKAEFYLFDALTGEKLEHTFPYPLSIVKPIDINGDGYSKFLYTARNNSWIGMDGGDCMQLLDRNGKLLFYAGGGLVTVGRWDGFAGEQFMTAHAAECKVRIWGDLDASENEIFKLRHAAGFHEFMNKQKGSGYNQLGSISCAM